MLGEVDTMKDKNDKNLKELIFFKVNKYSVISMLAAIAINLAGHYGMGYVSLPFWLDTIGTMFAAIQFGPLAGVIVGLCIAVAAVMMKLLSSVFAMIEKEDTPFTDKVIKRVTVVMIVISGFLFLTAGSALGILSGLATWVIYTVMDYGKTLQIQSDETL